MKATFEFDMTDMDEVQGHFRHTKALDMAIFIYDVIRDIPKCIFDDDESDDFNRGVQAVSDAIRESLRDRGLNIDDLIS